MNVYMSTWVEWCPRDQLTTGEEGSQLSFLQCFRWWRPKCLVEGWTQVEEESQVEVGGKGSRTPVDLVEVEVKLDSVEGPVEVEVLLGPVRFNIQSLRSRELGLEFHLPANRKLRLHLPVGRNLLRRTDRELLLLLLAISGQARGRGRGRTGGRGAGPSGSTPISLTAMSTVLFWICSR